MLRFFHLLGTAAMTIAHFEQISLTLGITALCGFMLFIIYDLAKQSNAGRFGTFVLFGALGLGIFGFGIKLAIETLMHV
jgi:Protein of unknown function (DUF2788)